MRIRKRKYPKDSERIYVSKHDIDHGIKSDCQRCPIGRALSRRFTSKISVTETSCEIGNREYSLCYKGIRFIRVFDDECNVEPFHLYIKRI